MKQITRKCMPPNDIATEIQTGEAELMTEEELEALQAKQDEEANQ